MSVKSLQKQLLAAVAMVVVAAIAMSSATFAWFVNNSQVSATGASATATTSKLLLISTDNSSYGTSTNLGVSLSAMTPVSASAALIKEGKFYKVKSWANGATNATTNPYGVLATTYVAASGGTTNSDYAVQDIFLKSDVAGSVISLDSTTTQLTASTTVTVDSTKYKVVATYAAGSITTAVYEGDSTTASQVNAAAVTKAEAQLSAALGALRVALVPYGSVSGSTIPTTASADGSAIVLTNSTTAASGGYYNTNGSAAGATAANINEAKVINTVTALVQDGTEYNATLAADPAKAISTYTSTVVDGEVQTPATTNIGTLTDADTPYMWKAYIYIEGCDSDCVSTIAGNVTYGVQLGFVQSIPSTNA
jgi:hypothetical protein